MVAQVWGGVLCGLCALTMASRLLSEGGWTRCGLARPSMDAPIHIGGRARPARIASAGSPRATDTLRYTTCVGSTQSLTLTPRQRSPVAQNASFCIGFLSSRRIRFKWVASFVRERTRIQRIAPSCVVCSRPLHPLAPRSWTASCVRRGHPVASLQRLRDDRVQRRGAIGKSRSGRTLNLAPGG